MKNILIPTDFSDNAMKAAEYAFRLYSNDSTFILLNSYEVPTSGATMLISISDVLKKESITQLEAEQTRLLDKHPELSGRIEMKSLLGSPNSAIKQASENADVVVMGTKGASGLKELLIGSVASNVLSDVNCPVLAIPDGVSSSSPKRILFAADDQCLSDGILPEELVALANNSQAEILILNIVGEGELAHVGSNPEVNTQPIATFEGVSHSVHFIEDKDINSGINRFMKNNPVDMLAMISRKNDLFS
ncbi:MAG: universal stress protein, partial [Flavobacteriales bacterium]